MTIVLEALMTQKAMEDEQGMNRVGQRYVR
jgi:hypothetical protein